MRSDYNAARDTRFRRRRRGVAATGSGADYHYRTEADYLRVMELARDMDRNDCIAGQAVNRLVVNTVQDGIKLDPQTGDDEVDAMLARRWAEWTEDPDKCDLAGELTFTEMERLVLRHAYVDGDIIALGNKGETGDTLELVEAHRLRTPTGTKRNVVHGVLMDQTRRRLEYWLTRDNIDPQQPLKLVGQVRPYPVRDAGGFRQIFHVYDPKRVTQTRGITAFAPIIDVLGMFEDINFARLVQAQVVSCFGLIRERELEFQGGADVQTGARTTETLGDGATRTIEGMGPGMDITGAPGEKLSMFSANVPNPEYFDHVKLILTLVGINLGLPLVMLLLDAKETNFSGWRGAVDQARQEFRRNQRWLIVRFHRPVYLWKVRQWLSEDKELRTAATRLTLSGDSIFAHRWNPPTWPYIEPLKDAKADISRLEGGLISPRRLFAERGRDYTEVAQEIVEDNGLKIELAIERAEQINKRYPDAMIDWREIIGFDLKGRIYSAGQRTKAPATITADAERATESGAQAPGPTAERSQPVESLT